MAEEKILKELELGVRELFRIFIPGAYAVVLVQLLTPKSDFAQLIAGRTTSALSAAFFLGLIGYALRVHERWFPYFIHFEKYRLILKNEIDRVIGSETPDDNVRYYKYFLETDAEKVNDRIHYFTSFYYMLVEVSLFSALGVLFSVHRWLFTLTGVSHHTAALFGTAAILTAVALQLGVEAGLQSIRTRRTKIIIGAEFLLLSAGFLVMLVAAYRAGGLGDVECLGWTPLLLLIVTYLFWRLAEKHWKQIINEQLVLVNHRADALIAVSRMFDSETGTTKP